MKYLKRFSKVSDYEAFKTGNDYITPNISLIDDGKRVYSEKKVGSDNNEVLTFPLKFELSDAIEVNVYDYATEYVFTPSDTTQQLLEWTQNQGLNFDTDHAGANGETSGRTIDIDENLIIVNNCSMVQVEAGVIEITFCDNPEEPTVCLFINKDNSSVYVEIY